MSMRTRQELVDDWREPETATIAWCDDKRKRHERALLFEALLDVRELLSALVASRTGLALPPCTYDRHTFLPDARRCLCGDRQPRVPL